MKGDLSPFQRLDEIADFIKYIFTGCIVMIGVALVSVGVVGYYIGKWFNG